jgi:hypothetical protein
MLVGPTLRVLFPLFLLSAASAAVINRKSLGRRADANLTVLINSESDYCLIVCLVDLAWMLLELCVDLDSIQLPKDAHTNIGDSEHPVSR